MTIRKTKLLYEEGIAAAVIAMAVHDIVHDNEHAQSARLYFLSDLYRQHMNLLDLDPDLLPVEVKGKI